MKLHGLATAHSHAFQRGLRGRTHALAAEGSFWSWRGLMYRFAERLDPASIHALSKLAYLELARAGVTAVGEFHYVHHQPDGTPYADRLELADAVIRAAREVGLRITLLRVLYQRAGHRAPPEGAQRRFSDASLDDALADVDALRRRHGSDPLVRVGLAPHSVRAVPREWIAGAAEYATAHGLPLHMHVSEQPREVEESLAEHGRRPVELLDELGVLGPRFCAVHATHLLPAEARALGGSHVCVCRTTERDLGDGSPDLGALVAAGARLSAGVDSHARSDPFEELRAMELDERARVGRRNVALDGEMLLEAGGANGYAAIGFAGAESEDEVVLDPRDLSLSGVERLGVVFAADARAVREVRVAGEAIVRDGRARGETGVVRDYEAALASLLAAG